MKRPSWVDRDLDQIACTKAVRQPASIRGRGRLLPDSMYFNDLYPPLVSTMALAKRSKGRDAVLSTLDVVIQGLNLAKDACGIPPAQIALGSASVLLTTIRVRILLLSAK